MNSARQSLRRKAVLVLKAALALVALQATTGCIVLGYSSRRGFFMWPGGITLLLILFVILALRRR